MLFLIVVLTLFVPFMAADVNAKTDAERLAEMFSPILILTEDTVSNYGEDKDRGILVLKPEPVDIMGATSAKNLRFWSVIANKKYEIDSYLNWVPPRLIFRKINSLFLPTVCMSVIHQAALLLVNTLSIHISIIPVRPPKCGTIRTWARGLMLARTIPIQRMCISISES